MAPPTDSFDEAWQAQVLAIADAMVRAGHFSASDWAKALGDELRAARAEPDTLETYYLSALSALEKLSAAKTSLTATAQSERASAWRRAYEKTPHGAPVCLPDAPRSTLN